MTYNHFPLSSFYTCLIFTCGIFLVSACQKDAKEANIFELTSTDCWVPVKFELFDSTNNIWDDLFLDCMLDACHTFEANGDYTVDFGLDRCNPSGPQTLYGTWDWGDNETDLIIDLYGTTYHYAIIELTKNKLVYEELSGAYVYRYTFKPK